MKNPKRREINAENRNTKREHKKDHFRVKVLVNNRITQKKGSRIQTQNKAFLGTIRNFTIPDTRERNYGLKSHKIKPLEEKRILCCTKKLIL